MELFKYLTDATGVSECACRLLFSIFFSYPIAWFYRASIHGRSPREKYYFFATCGVALGAFNYGLDVCHHILAVLFTNATLRMLGSTKTNVILNLVFHLTYLQAGYWFTDSDTYNMTWTMPHCVLILRLIGLCIDLLDGSKDFETLSVSSKKTALREKPDIIEIFSYVFFPASYLVGPQFSMMRLKNFVNGQLENCSKPTCVSAGAVRGLTGLCYLAAYQAGITHLSEKYFLTEEFFASSIIWKHVVLGIFMKIFVMKYVSCWLLTEGACITFGIAYNGLTDNNTSLWDGCRNVKLQIFEGCTRIGHYIESFNVNTNTWAAQYVYKRMAFLGNRYISQFITLTFLAFWHGLHSGNYMAFFMEFAIVFMEKDLESILRNSKTFSKLSQNKLFKIISFVVGKVYANIFMGYALIPFALLTFDKWWVVYKAFYFSGFIFFFPWAIIYRPIIVYLLNPTKSKEKERAD